MTVQLCEYCGESVGSPDGCAMSVERVGRLEVIRYRYGKESWYVTDGTPQCLDCGTGPDRHHHAGCSFEMCAGCGKRRNGAHLLSESQSVCNCKVALTGQEVLDLS